MNNILKKIVFLAVLALFYSCDNDIDLNADYQTYPFVYCILDQDDTTHYVRVGKSFQTDVDIDDIDNLEDSIYYETIDVSIYHLINGNRSQTISFTPNLNFPKEEGYFPNTSHTVFSSNETFYSNNEYELEIIIEDSPDIITAKTKLLSDVVLNSEYYSPLFKLNFALSTPQLIEWQHVENVKLYDVFMRFHYKEIMNFDTTDHYFDFPIQSIIHTTELNMNDISIDIAASTFYNHINSNIDENEEVRRIFTKVDLGFSLFAKELHAYMEISENIGNTGLTLTNYDFDNIQNGIGVFSSQKTTIIPGFDITNRSIDTLSCGALTRHLNFADHEGFYFCINQ